MPQCTVCHDPAEELARTPTRVWLGCRNCHSMWHADPDNLDVPAAVQRFSDDGSRFTRVSAAVMPVLVGVACVLAAGAARVALSPALGDAGAFLLFAPAVSIAAYLRGPVGGATATLLSACWGGYFFLSPPGEEGIEAWDHVALFVLVGILITAVSTVSRNSRRRLSEALWRAMVARAEAEAADRQKEEFVALISHELRTPASVILGWTNILHGRRLSTETLDRAIDAIERSARMQSRLVSDMLDRSRMVAGTLRMERARVTLGPIVRAAVEHVQAESGARTPRISLSLPNTEPHVMADELRLQQVFVNVLANAVKFTPPDGRIDIAITGQDDTVEVTVSDTGAGISPDFLPRMFDLFSQSTDTVERSRRGLGLGLSVVRHLVERHGGTVRAESEGPGHGTTIRVVLPVAPDSATLTRPHAPAQMVM